MKLQQAVTEYVAHQHTLGMHFVWGESILIPFIRAVGGDVELKNVSKDAVRSYLMGKGVMTPYVSCKYSVLKGFYRFAMARGYVSTSPLPKTLPKITSTFAPYIYSREELKNLFAATDALEKHWDVLRAPTIRTILILLYGTGLRCSEAVDLTVADVELADNLLIIRESKFYKTRLVPISPQLSTVLYAYFQKRKRWHRPITGNSAFFATVKKPSLTRQHVESIFKDLRVWAGLYRPERGSSQQPRIHDLRHTSAVHRLIAWYREGKDVQKLLPYLSAYLGHQSLSGTQRYLSMTPELLTEVNQRFEGYALSEVNHD